MVGLHLHSYIYLHIFFIGKYSYITRYYTYKPVGSGKDTVVLLMSRLSGSLYYILLCILITVYIHTITDEAPVVDIRLVDGIDSSQGRVEVGLNGAWGTVCDYGWDILDANVVCRQLGFDEALAATHDSSFGYGRGRIWLYNVNCNGGERGLLNCSHSGWGYSVSSCDHANDAGVICKKGW